MVEMDETVVEVKMKDAYALQQDEWLQKTWRPAIGVTYIAINICDFIIFPVLWSLFEAYTTGDLTPWEPLTLKAAGTFHIAFGAILGVAAWTRGQEKIAKI